jgi:hypothetical protein
MSLHFEMHLSICVLYGIWVQKRAGASFSFSQVVTNNLFDALFVHFQFEYQQAQLEAEIENLSWKIERAETTDRGELQNQMDIAEKRRSILLKDFLEV